MKMLLVGSAFVGVLMTSGSDATVTQFDHSSSMKVARPSAAIAHKTRKTQIVDVDYRLSDQELSLIAFLRLKTEAERSTR
jgi:hypothetical protein